MSSFYLYAKDNSASSSLKYSSEDGYVNYCCMINGYSNSYAIWFGCGNIKETCEQCNIINNSHLNSGRGIVDTNWESAIITINKCCLIKNNANNIGYLFYSEGTMYVKECTIQNEYNNKGALTSYSNTVAGSECVAISNCGTKNVNTNEDKFKCTICDFEILHKLQKLYLNKQFYYK
jgi:hypothetical protein